jgi:phosphatidylglycerol:prolipoprotein diacylglycerol transferase
VIPYIHLPDGHIGPIPIHVFGILVATGVYIGISLARWRAKKVGVDAVVLESFITWMLACGFIGAHVLDVVFYHPDVLRTRWYSIFFLWESLSSFGGFIGAFTGILLWKRFKGKGQALLPLADVILAVFPISWIFGRAGCAIVHDHPGMYTSASNPLAVAYPDGPKYDLGMLEMMFAVVVSLICVILWRRKTRVGTYVVLTTLLYAPVRFVMDFLRIRDGGDADIRYVGLTMAQWSCVALFLLGLSILVKIVRNPPQVVQAPEAETAPQKKRKGKRKSAAPA